ncbi:MAG: hypothetical protein JSU87_10880 [Gemmatimonadota bacterium]|nr:MAG: hypothetical protein JSU87_10880 [Gemmatimonadota bacterium]
MRYPLAGRETLAALTAGSGLFTGALGLVRAVAKRALGPLAIPVAVGGGLMWLGRNLGDAYVELDGEKLRVKLGVLFDEVIPLNDISRVRQADWPLLGGLGVRTNMRDLVAVVTRPGPVAEISLWRPYRLPVIPHVYWVRAQRILVSPKDLEAFSADLQARLVS